MAPAFSQVRRHVPDPPLIGGVTGGALRSLRPDVVDDTIPLPCPVPVALSAIHSGCTLDDPKCSGRFTKDRKCKFILVNQARKLEGLRTKVTSDGKLESEPADGNAGTLDDFWDLVDLLLEEFFRESMENDGDKSVLLAVEIALLLWFPRISERLWILLAHAFTSNRWLAGWLQKLGFARKPKGRKERKEIADVGEASFGVARWLGGPECLLFYVVTRWTRYFSVAARTYEEIENIVLSPAPPMVPAGVAPEVQDQNRLGTVIRLGKHTIELFSPRTNRSVGGALSSAARTYNAPSANRMQSQPPQPSASMGPPSSAPRTSSSVQRNAPRSRQATRYHPYASSQASPPSRMPSSSSNSAPSLHESSSSTSQRGVSDVQDASSSSSQAASRFYPAAPSPASYKRSPSPPPQSSRRSYRRTSESDSSSVYPDRPPSAHSYPRSPAQPYSPPSHKQRSSYLSDPDSSWSSDASYSEDDYSFYSNRNSSYTDTDADSSWYSERSSSRHSFPDADSSRSSDGSSSRYQRSPPSSNEERSDPRPPSRSDHYAPTHYDPYPRRSSSPDRSSSHYNDRSDSRPPSGWDHHAPSHSDPHPRRPSSPRGWAASSYRPSYHLRR